MDVFSMVVGIVLISSIANVLKAFAGRPGRGANIALQNKVDQQDATIGELRRRVEHLEALASDPIALAAMRVQQGLNSGGVVSVPTRFGQ